MSFNRAQYERLVQISRDMAAISNEPVFRRGDLQELAEEIFNMSEEVIGQQPPLFERD